MEYKHIEGGVTAPVGFKAAAAAAGIKYSGRDDMAMIFCDKDCTAAGVFTSNIVKAAPVKWDRDIVRDPAKNGLLRAVVVNAGIANACTGQDGLDACAETARAAGEALGVNPDQVLLGSTGVIGSPLPVDRVSAGVKLLAGALSADASAGEMASKAIMTTDTVNKEIAFEFTLGGKTCRIGMMSKGVGMIEPNMCTMLAFVTTDADIAPAMLDKALREAVSDSFNMISVDGDMSTNDTLVIMADGLCGNERIEAEGEEYAAFAGALRKMLKEQAKKHAADGEGATALFEVKVVNADTASNARVLAKSVVNSMLTKAAIFGHDANGGRILCALGYAGVDFDPDAVDLTVESAAGSVPLYRMGAKLPYDEDFATKVLSEKTVTAVCDMHMGTEDATAWGCDLSYDYVKINADYRS
ncbi:MAG: bifunctional glutamate N-acetyltransferase/amino-acid acetyltransferase ArgJ [Lachnospiraceae bacterium]|nr:bifunctional glutamate N-acetyltransferase/amino-acid acetyltransferase ArgJ [Lachnospiraceae bacterium]